VLVVDDDADAHQLFRRMLQAQDEALEVVTASSGTEALETLRQQPFDLMLLDIRMPDMDGWEVLAAVRADDTLADVPTLFVSAQDPADRTPSSPFLLATIGEGLSLRKVVDCALDVSTLLLKA
jgi:CheY-like chemotaxis protein